MRFELDSESARGFAFTLAASNSVFLDASSACRVTRPEAVAAVGADHPFLPAAVDAFVRAHGVAFEAFATAFAGMSGDVRTVIDTHSQLEAAIESSLNACLFEPSAAPRAGGR